MHIGKEGQRVPGLAPSFTYAKELAHEPIDGFLQGRQWATAMAQAIPSRIQEASIMEMFWIIATFLH